MTAFCLLALAVSTAQAEIGVTNEKILVGRNSSLTGTNAALSIGIDKGAQLYLDKINAAGGVAGRKIELITYDDGYKPPVALENVKKLNETDKVFCLFSLFGSAANKAVRPYVDHAGLPVVAPMVSAEEQRLPLDKNYFFVRPSSDAEEHESLKYAVKTLGLKKIAVIYQNDSLGQSSRLAAIATLHDLGIKLEHEASADRDGSNTTALVQGLAKSNVEVVLIGASQIIASATLKAANALGFKPVYIALTSNTTSAFLDTVKQEKAKVYFTSVVPIVIKTSKSKLVQDFLNDAAAAKVNPDDLQLEGYLNAMVFVEGLKRAGKDLTRASLISALETINGVDFGGVKITYSATNHRGSSSIFIGTTKDGKLVPID